MTTLPAGLFDGLTSLRNLLLSGNRLTTLPEGVFDSLTNFWELDLSNNHLVGLTRNDPLFAALPSDVDLSLGGQTAASVTTRLPAIVPLMISASDSMRQGFVRIINESDESGSVRILAFDDGGAAAEPIEIQLGANQAVHFNSDDLENVNAAKGINAGIGSPVQGDWRLDIESALDVRVLAFVRTGDGFLTAMHDVLPRDANGELVAWIFNPPSNTTSQSKLRLINTGLNLEVLNISAEDDAGVRHFIDVIGRVELNPGESRTVTGLGRPTGKSRLFITAGEAVVGMSLLEAASGHLTNLSTAGDVTGDHLQFATKGVATTDQ